jgi:Carboxypeptidase regulatory-like domain
MTLLRGSWCCPSSDRRVSRNFVSQPPVGPSRQLALMLKLACVALLLSLTFTSAWAQSTATGTVSGQVTDQTGAAIAGANVTLTDTATNTSRSTTSNDVGRYIFVNVTPGAYGVRITKTGFAQTVTKVTVEIGQVSNASVALKVGTATETVEVTTTGVEMQTMNAAVGSTVHFTAMEVLPNLSRDSSTLMTLQPAVNPTGEVAGSVRDQNTFQLDGGQNSSDMDGTQSTYTLSFAANPSTNASSGGLTTGVLPTPVESIEEFKVATNNQTADFNGSSGGQVQMVTKRGTNAFHGALYEYYLGSNFSANFWDNNFTHTPLPSTHQNRFGGAFGGPLTPWSFLGGKTFFFANYEGRRFPNIAIYERAVPSALFRQGIIQLSTAPGVVQAFNIDHSNTIAGIAPTACGGSTVGGNCDPRNIGFNPIIKQLWSQFEPLPNDPNFGDTLNSQGYKTPVALPRNDDFGVTRIDHDFGQKWHFTGTYHYYRVTVSTTDQVDIGGVIPGDTLGQATSHSHRPSVASLITAGLTTNVSPNLTNDFHYSYTRNWWQWITAAAPPQLAGLGGALEIGGESRTGSLVPMNVNTQSARQRFWDGQDNYLRDDITLLKGNHLLQFGGTYQRNWDYHQRNDNGQGIMNAIVYQIAISATDQGGGINMPSGTFFPTGVSSSLASTWNPLYTELLGMTSQPQVLFTRSGSNLTLNPLGSFMFDKSTIPSYNVYFGDTWHIKSNLSLSFGAGYTIEMPPVEQDGKQVELIDSTGKLVDLQNYLNTKKSMALQGQVFNPILGFETVKNLGMKYPYNTFYGGISPRAAVAWNPHFEHGIPNKIFGTNETVIRGGYNRIYGRLNGVDLVLVPLLGTGLGQAVSCIGAVRPAFAVGGSQCLGSGGSDPNSSFRIGVDGMTAPLPAVSQTLPQPYFPGLNGNPAAGDGQALDPNFRPSRSDEFDFTIQRQLSRKVSLEVGYIGRILKNEYQSTNLDAVPYMLTLNGQSFANTYDTLYTALTSGTAASAVPIQPWFEAALGPTSNYCKTFPSCTVAVATREGKNAKGLSANVYSFWTDIANSPLGGFLFGRAMPSTIGAGGQLTPGQVSSVYLNGSWGYGNYNAVFATVRTQAMHGLSMVSNFTWSKTLGTQAVAQSTSGFTPTDAFNLHNQYGPQPFDLRFVYNAYMVYEPSWYKSQRGVLGHLLGGWKISPIFTARSGLPVEVNVGSDCQSYGEVNCGSGSTNENAIMLAPMGVGSISAHYNVPGGTCNGTAVGTSTKDNINMFANPAAAWCNFRPPLVGFDNQTGGQGILRGFPAWNLDASVAKEIKLTERVNTKFIATFTNVFNHVIMNDPGLTGPNGAASPSLNIARPSQFGVIFGQNNVPRQMEFGIRIGF